ncbi:tRNA uridine-5-carboxymethylaminomethyl(34) synthesis GTPase MnmE [Aestuariivirga litoralis]|uniref:tRNA uridine-5-carboxymethylaminomethyl(34) synthesis GTPase MnmE n=1 Tax=Aestuariivirga litoralis TaxID=2650924 RepID=UPI0018C7906A|nr:tRNA uridine-5-carboxymethylaminomethyl(34) synthesis GTPase MnmE [Aestuariivirga litoralis]MBG1233771.1 tRNA uridine-5-carboxymethylaminomethyl(34) synthesis GTPase MnmE [Aestuariivirga litoralis]
MSTGISSDTIFALSSGQGKAGIAVIRISGPRAGAVLEEMAVRLPQPRVASVRKLKARDGQVIDEAMVLWFSGPASATGEDMAELHVHGAPAIIEFIFSELSNVYGLRLADRGEFSRRAFHNDKLDLVEIEGLADLLAATGEAQRRLAMRQFLGEASGAYEGWRRQVIEALALHEAAIDFVEEDDVADRARDLAQPVIKRLVAELEAALSTFSQNAALRSGLKVVIAGAPNVGKSSFLNALARREAAIVSDIAGTTRDIVEAQVMFEGLPLTLTDTAGFRSATDDMIEKMGIERAAAAVSDADILIWVSATDITDSSDSPRTPDIRILNKADLPSIHTRNDAALPVSTRTGAGLDELRLALSSEIKKRMANVEHAVVVRQRHAGAVSDSIRLLNKVLDEPSRPHELIAEDLRKAARALGSITGHVDVEDLLGKIFSEFCIGK